MQFLGKRLMGKLVSCCVTDKFTHQPAVMNERMDLLQNVRLGQTGRSRNLLGRQKMLGSVPSYERLHDRFYILSILSLHRIQAFVEVVDDDRLDAQLLSPELLERDAGFATDFREDAIAYDR